VRGTDGGRTLLLQTHTKLLYQKAANREQYQFNRKGLNFGEKINAMINQKSGRRGKTMGHVLQYAESKRE